MYFLRKLH